MHTWRVSIVVVGLLLLAGIGWSVIWLALYARRCCLEGRWLPASLAVLVGVGLLVPALFVVDMLGFALFWQS